VQTASIRAAHVPFERRLSNGTSATTVLVLWRGSNDCALEALDCPQPAFTRLTYMAPAAHAAGWKVVAVTMIARGSWFANAQFQARFPFEQAALNSLIRNSSEFDAVAETTAA
jgi:hypothetical protein